MKQCNLAELSTAELNKKSNSLKAMIGLFVFLALAILFMVIRDYRNGGELEIALITVAICTLGGAATVLPQLKEVREELKSRAEKAEA